MPRPRRRTLAVTAAALATVAAAVTLPLFQPWRLFTDNVVDEGLPGSAPISTKPSSTAAPTISAEPRTPGTPGPAATTRPRSTEPVRVAAGRFVTHEHDTTGTVALYKLADGSHVLRLENLATSDGPDLKVWLTDAPVIEGRDGWHVFDDGRYANLGKLKGNQGNQNYPLPAGTDPASFRSVTIWCDRFNVSFGAAALS